MPSLFNPRCRTDRVGMVAASIAACRRHAGAHAIRRSLVVAGIALLSLSPLASTRADELQDVSKLVAAGRIDDAEKRADAFLAKTPKDAQMRFLKGVILAQRGKRDEAVAVFTALTQDFPELPEPYNNVAVIYAAQGRYDAARDALETAIRVAPQYATAHENLGDVYAALAARSYQATRRYDANNASALRKLNAAKALLVGSPVTGAAASAAPAAPSSPTAAAPSTDVVRSQRNVGQVSPVAPRVSVGGFGATAPEIVVPVDAKSVPVGADVVAIEARPPADDPNATSVLAGARTVVGPDPSDPIAAVTAAVRQWAQARSLTADDLRIRVDGDTAVARFHETPATGTKTAAPGRALTLKLDAGAWTVTDARNDS